MHSQVWSLKIVRSCCLLQFIMDSHTNINPVRANLHLTVVKRSELRFVLIFEFLSAVETAVVWIPPDCSFGGVALWWHLIRRASHLWCQSSTCSVHEIPTFLSPRPISFHVSPFHLLISSSFYFLLCSCPAASNCTQTHPIHVLYCTPAFIRPHNSSGPSTGRREGANVPRIRRDSLREKEGTKEERRGGRAEKRGGNILLKWK